MLVFSCGVGRKWLVYGGTRLMPEDGESRTRPDLMFRALVDECGVIHTHIPRTSPFQDHAALIVQRRRDATMTGMGQI